MNKTIKILLLPLLVGFGVHNHAAVNNVGGGVVSDSIQNITWMKDANVFKTLCDADHPLAIGFNSSGITCLFNGAMTWNSANSWVAYLNDHNYLGFNDWRLPNMLLFDGSCEGAEPGSGYNCQKFGSELSYLHNVTLRNPNAKGIGDLGNAVDIDCSGNCFENAGPFINVHGIYWSNLKYISPISGDDVVEVFDFSTGYKGNKAQFDFGFPISPSINYYVWPVRTGSTTPRSPPDYPINENIIVVVGKPVNGSKLTGTITITGWAISPNGISDMELYVDGIFHSSIPRGSARPDVGLAYPDVSGAYDSGFAITYPVSKLPAGEHNFSVYAYDYSGNMNFVSSDVITDEFNNTWASNQEVDLSSATVSKSGNDILVNNISLNGVLNDLKMQWDQTTQSFSIIEID